MKNDYYKIKVSSDSSGDGKIYEGYPLLQIFDSLFIFDLNMEVFEYLKEFYKTHKINTTTIFQLERYKDIENFKEALTQLIRYAIFENQNLCDKLFVLSIKDEYTKAASEIGEKEKKKITKFRGREFPNENFVKEFLPIAGSCSISPAPELIDMNNLVSWFFEIEYKEFEDSEEFDFDPEKPDEIPIPLEPGIEMPPIPEPPSSGGDDSSSSTSITYSIIYYNWNEVTSIPIVKSVTRPFNNIVTSNAIPQNTVTVHVKKQKRVEIVVNTNNSES